MFQKTKHFVCVVKTLNEILYAKHGSTYPQIRNGPRRIKLEMPINFRSSKKEKILIQISVQKRTTKFSIQIQIEIKLKL